MTVTHPFPPSEPGMIAGRSAWTLWGHSTGSKYYLFKSLATMDGRSMVEPEDQAVHHAIAGIQRALNAVGYRHPILGPIPVTGVFGPRTQWGVKWYQGNRGLVKDGAFGPKTASALFVPLVKYISSNRVPAAHILGMFAHESAWDSGAVSTYYRPVNGPDRGLAQINKNAHKDVTDEQAFDALFSIEYAVNRLQKARVQFSGKGPDLQNVCSIAQHNSPARAVEWYEVGWMGEDTQIYKYVQAILTKGAALV